MSCCGDRRARLAGSALTSAPFVPTLSGPRATSRDPALVYRGPVPMVLRGPRSNRIYRILEAGQLVQVATSDAPALMRTGWFAKDA